SCLLSRLARQSSPTTKRTSRRSVRNSRPGASHILVAVIPELDFLGGVRRCAVLGSPIAHSLSPALHRAASGYPGLNWPYDRVPVDEQGLASFVCGLDASWRGLSLTMPLKVAVLELGEVDQLGSLAGAGSRGGGAGGGRE